MVDIDTIKPGDMITFKVHPNSKAYADGDGLRLEIFDGEEFPAFDPPVSSDGLYVRVKHEYFPSGYFLATPEVCHMKGMPAALKCTCDSFKVLMVSGCKCDAMQREREAVR